MKRSTFNLVSSSKSSGSGNSVKYGLFETKRHSISVDSQSIFVRFSLKDIEPAELARQLTLLEADIFSRLSETEFYHRNYLSESKEKLAPHICKLVDRFNTVSFWVATEIVMAMKTQDRVALIKKFIKTAEELRDLGNFNGVGHDITAR